MSAQEPPVTARRWSGPLARRLSRSALGGLVTTELTDPDADVLVVTNLWPRDDHRFYGVFVQRQVESLRSHGIRCEVLFVRGYRSQLAYPAAAAVLLWRTLARRRPYRLVHSHGGEVVAFARAYLRAPLLSSFCGDDLIGTPRADGTVSHAQRMKARVLRALAWFATATITKSKEMEARLPRPVARRNLVLPNGVDRAAFTPIDRDRARSRLGWDPEQVVVLFAGNRDVARKRYWLAEQAIERANRAGPGLRLEVASGVSPQLMPVIMSAADCLLLTSVSEGSPNVVKEALAVDLPVVTTRVGDVEELLDGVVPSALAEADPDALADGLHRCVDPPRRSNGRARTAWLDSDVIAGRLIELYARLAPDAADGVQPAPSPAGRTSGD